MRRSPRFLALVVLTTSAQACTTKLGVPDKALIACQAQSDCPTGLTCRASLGRCVQPGADDTPPSVTASSTDRPNAGPLAPVHVTFTVSEALASAPVVRLGSPDAAAFTLESTSGLSYDFALTPGASVAEGAWPVLADLIDLAGNRASDVALGTVVVDHTAPAVVAPSIYYTPDGGNPLERVTAARDGTGFLVYFSTTEPVGAAPVVTAGCAGAPAPGLTLEPTPGNSDTFFGYAITLSPADVASDGPCPLHAAFVDRAANVGVDDALAALSLEVARTVPDAGVAMDLSLVEQLRAPYGAFQTAGGQGQYLAPAAIDDVTDPATTTLPAAAFGAAGGAALVEVRAWGSDAGGLLLGQIHPVPGGWEVPLLRADTAQMWLSVIDGAGNESARRRVPVTDWLVTSGGKKRGSTFENPVTVLSTAAFVPTEVQDPYTTIEPAQPDLDALGASDGTSLTLGGEGSWKRRFPATADNPPGTYRTVMTYDPITGVSFLFGGYSGCNAGSSSNQLWQWDGLAWQVGHDQQYRPLPRDGVRLAVDSRRGQLVLSGGAEQDLFADTWEWDVRAQRWLERSTPTAPTPRTHAAFAYDRERGVMVSFGGNANSGYGEKDLCEYDGDAGDWTLVTETTPWPSARTGVAAAYDEVTGRVIVFGGGNYPSGTSCDTGASYLNGFCYFGDTWAWDGQSWTLVSDTGSGPPERMSHTMAFDGLRGRVLLYGGDQGRGYFDDMWQWTAAGGWSQVLPTGSTAAPARSLHAMAYDPLRDRVVVHAGESVNVCPAPTPSTFEWNPTTGAWKDCTPAATATPVPRDRGVMMSEGPGGGVLLFGGVSYGNQAQIYDLWSYDVESNVWTSIAASIPGLSVETTSLASAATFDWGRRVVVFVRQDFQGGTNPQVWENAIDAPGWAAVGQSGSLPYPRADMAVTYDASRGRVVMIGGDHYDATATPCPDGNAKVSNVCYYGDLREWSGLSWTLRTPSTTFPGRRGMRMAFDTTRNTVLIAGGADAQSYADADSYLWDGATSDLTLLTPAGENPAARIYHDLAYDPDRDKVVIFAGYQSDLHEWDAPTSSWTQRNVVLVSPTPTRNAAAAYDTQAHRLVVYGGEKTLDQLWLWDGGSATRPALIWSLPLQASGVGDAGTPVELDVRVRGSGTGYAGSTPVAGLALRYWNRGVWTEAGVASGAPGEWSLTLSGAAQVHDALFGDTSALVLAIAPAGDNGTSPVPATISIDAVEARVRYEASPPAAAIASATARPSAAAPKGLPR